jgi:hypothetical protein
MLYGILIFCVCWLFVYIDNYCKNPYKLEAVVGSKGSGKSLYMSLVGWVLKSFSGGDDK